MASNLALLQEALLADIRTGSTAAVGRIKVPKGADAQGRLGVYQNAYKLRLAGILREEYPVLWAFMGEREFWRMAHRFIDACPSGHPNARMVPTRLPRFLETDDRYRDRKAVCEIAALEDAFSRAFDARDAELTTMADFTAFPAEHIAALRLVFAPEVSLVPVSTNAAEICKCVWAGRPAPEAAELPGPVSMLVWRQGLESKYRVVEAEEAMLVGETMAGKDFAALCEMAAFMNGAETAPARLAGYLTTWINAQMIAGLHASG